ncbi:MAG: hypothetical protein KME20_15805 [Kaiparowitsia implicata GSE-PSE-MK54-09C]|jgi:hypothetical protein|nr:hypothetical protein [Kaiparowitsia implicata GSE-PSE-MK54-09C]
MAEIVECPKCGKKTIVSTLAPLCGTAPHKSKQLRPTFCQLSLVFLCIAALLLAYLTMPEPSPPAPVPQSNQLDPRLLQ